MGYVVFLTVFLFCLISLLYINVPYLYSGVSEVVLMAEHHTVLRGHVSGRDIRPLKITSTSVDETSEFIQY